MGNVPLVEAEVVVFCELFELDVVEAVLVLLVVFALVVFDDGDEVDGDDVVVPGL